MTNDAIRGVLVTGFEHLADELCLADPDDEHVLAAAIHAQADLIVTFNLKDFPEEALAAHGVLAQHPDAFLVDRFNDNEALFAEAVRSIAEASKNPPYSIAEIVARLDGAALPALAERLRDHFHLLEVSYTRTGAKAARL